MPLLVNLRQLEDKDIHLTGDLSAEDLDVVALDELIHVRAPLCYDLTAQMLERGVLVQGRLRLDLDCECARCLKAFQFPLALEGWTRHLALAGEEKVAVTNDCVDLTPYIREDIVLAFPQHPLCEPECRGLASPRKDLAVGGVGTSETASSAWAELNKLKF